MNSLSVQRRHLVGVPLRRLELAQKVYVKDSDFKKVKAGKSYLLEPTSDTLGRIVSDDVIRGGTVVSADHCQTVFTDPIYSISEAYTHQQMGQRMADLFGNNSNAFEAAEGGGGSSGKRKTQRRRTYKKKASKRRQTRHRR
jgi:hypothetical protein